MTLSIKKRIKRLNKSTCESDKRIDFTRSLFSKELVLKVFGFLSSSDLVQCAAVNYRWFQIANDELLWKPLFIKTFSTHEKPTAIRYGGSWKTKYRIHHNWLLGNYNINDVVQRPDDSTPHHIQFLHDVLFISQRHTIDIWQYRKERSSRISQLNASTSQVCYLKLVDHQPTVRFLIASYADGQLCIWQINGLSSADLAITHQLSHMAHPAVSLDMHYPLLAIYTVQKTLVVYRLDGPELVEIACLQSPMDWSPVIMDIQPMRSPGRWQVVLCFGSSSSHSGPSSVGIQEMIFSDSRLLSSRQGMYTYPMSLSCASLDQITSMVYAAPYLITAHPNNTMKQYRITNRGRHLDISFQQTLYGHTCRVDALAIAKQKLISGDRSGIKIWDLARQQQVMTLNIYPDQSSMNELPESSIRTLGFDEDKIVAVVNDNNNAFVRLWSFN
ncbi:F-box/WD repeat-containing protein 7 [Choanephora cucurbitarum]|uniref:F-box/WD repeat-containing protein 7 n=1 Tax=Choanephora cucurbitarum TaxID=101091 RepID=A0A1C7N136_9FUNG|nr:F-box/WD repeat-containing protein 7 [Choanephora cucurbitarum]